MYMTSRGLNIQIKRALHGHKSPLSFLSIGILTARPWAERSSCSARGLLLLNRAAVGWAVSCFALGLFFIFSLVGEQTKTPTHGQLSSPDDVIISQLQAISQLFSSYPPSGGFCRVSELTVYTKTWRPKGRNVQGI